VAGWAGAQPIVGQWGRARGPAVLRRCRWVAVEVLVVGDIGEREVLALALLSLSMGWACVVGFGVLASEVNTCVVGQ